VVALAVAGGRPGEAAGIPAALREAIRGRPDLAQLLEDYTFRRSVTSAARVLDRDLHEFLLSHPDVGAELARLRGAGPYHVRRVAPAVFEGTDGDGAWATLRVLDAAPGLRVFHARGRYAARLLPDVSGEALVLLTTRYETTGAGDLVHGRLTVHARLDGAFQHALLRALVPLVGAGLDRKIARAFASESVAVERLVRQPHVVLARLRAAPHLRPPDVAALRDLLERAHAAGHAVPVASAP
jgi:hypothetical protein